jgi:ribulose-5-phosphate 4-epimerase/fuculose-1-phosphate aldolase
VHDLLVIKNYSSLEDIGVVENYPYGTLELARGVAKALRNCNYVVIRGHGIVAIGKDIDQALGLVMKNREAIQSKKIKYSKDD